MALKSASEYLKNYLPAHLDIKYIGIWAAILYTLLGIFFVFVFENNIYFLLAMGGVINSAFIEIRVIEFHYIHRNLFVCAINITSILPFLLGCMSSGNILFSIIGLVIASFILSVTGDANKVAGTFAFVFALMFILGLNLHAVFIHALYYGLAIAAGGGIM